MVNVASPSASTGSTMPLSIFIYFLFIFKCVDSPHRKVQTHRQDNAWDTIVASAAPRTPIWNKKIKTGSSKILAIAPISTENIPSFAKPCAVMNAFIPSVTCTKTVPSAYRLM